MYFLWKHLIDFVNHGLEVSARYLFEVGGSRLVRAARVLFARNLQFDFFASQLKIFKLIFGIASVGKHLRADKQIKR